MNNRRKNSCQARKRPLLSFIIPAFNAESTIEKCLQSVTKQGLDSYELIVVDDGSTDATQTIVLNNSNHNTRYYYKKNGGVSSARNYGLNKSTGEWIVFLDADDRIIGDSLNRLMSLLLDSANDFIVTPIAAYAKNDEIQNTTDNRVVNKHDFIDEIIYRLPNNNTSGMVITRNLGGNIIRRSVIVDNKIRFIDGLRFFEDGIFNLFAAHASRKIMYSDTLFYDYDSTNEKSRMNTFCPDIANDNAVIDKEISSFLKRVRYDSASLPYLRVELFSTSLFAIALEKTATKKKIEKIRQIDKLYLSRVKGKIKMKYLSKVLKVEYRLCTLKLYRALILLCKIKAGVKRARGRM